MKIQQKQRYCLSVYIFLSTNLFLLWFKIWSVWDACYAAEKGLWYHIYKKYVSACSGADWKNLCELKIILKYRLTH